jgi:hypothetical protein
MRAFVKMGIARGRVFSLAATTTAATTMAKERSGHRDTPTP